MSEHDIFHYLIPACAAALGPVSYLLFRLFVLPRFAPRAERSGAYGQSWATNITISDSAGHEYRTGIIPMRGAAE